jgi:lysophospholipase L1-like esterase
LVVTVVAGLVAWAAPTWAVAPAAADQRRLGVGDSIMLSAEQHLSDRRYAVNARSGRHVDEGVAVLRRKAEDGTLRDVVVVHLGTNGSFTSDDCRAMKRAVTADRTLVLLTVKVPRNWQKPNNQVIRDCADEYGNTELVDWRAFALEHPEAIADDGYHLTSKGTRMYARFVDRTVDQIVSAAGSPAVS